MIPVTVKGGLEVDMPNGKSLLVNKTGQGYGDVEAKVEDLPPKGYVSRSEAPIVSAF